MPKIKINVESSTTVPLESLEPFQGTLKHIEKSEYEKLRKVLIEQGFSFAVHIWQHGGKNHIIDGHQRVFVLKQMKASEGFDVPDIPVSIVKAKTLREAKLRVLAGASQYGKLDKDGLREFMTENDIEFEDLVSNFDFPEIDFGDFGKEFLDINNAVEEIDEPVNVDKTMQSGSGNVKQIQLFFDNDTHAEFVTKLESLSQKFGTDNITDSVMECVRESHKSLK